MPLNNVADLNSQPRFGKLPDQGGVNTYRPTNMDRLPTSCELLDTSR